MNRYIEQLIGQGEHQQLDFKFEISDAKKIAKTLVAFANTDGGTLLIGVKDNGVITGIRSDEEYYMLESAAKLYCRPEISFTAKPHTIEGKTLLEVHIPKGNNKPYSAKDEEGKWWVYIRKEDQNLMANNVLIKTWKKEKRKKGIFIHFSKKERILLDYLEHHPSISLSKFCKTAKIPRYKAEDILVNFIILGIIKQEINEKQITYTLAAKNDFPTKKYSMEIRSPG